MAYSYIIELWNQKKRRYVKYWEGSDFRIAERMFDKSYFSRETRRMLRISVEVLYTEKTNGRRKATNL